MTQRILIILFAIIIVVVPAVAQETRWRELQRQAEGFLEQRNYKEGLRAAQKAIREAERTFGAEHLNVAASLYVFAEIHRLQQTCREARPLHERALSIREKVLGPEHVDVAQSLDSLGWAYRCLGQPAEAKPLHERVLAIREKALGPDHTQVAESLWTVAWYDDRLSRAALLYKRALAIWEKAPVQNNALLAARLFDLGASYDAEFMYVEADLFYQRSLAIQEKVASSDSTLLVKTLRGLGWHLLRDRRDVERGTGLMLRALEIRKSMPKPDLNALAEELDWLASHYFRELKRYGEAEPLFLQELAIREQVPGRRGLGESYRRVGGFYESWGKLEKAEPFYKRAIEIMKAEHTDPTEIANTLVLHADLLKKLQRLKEAEEVDRRADAIRQDRDVREMEPTFLAAEKELSKLRLEDIKPEHGEAAAFLMLYVGFLRNTQRAGKAAKLEARLQKIMAQAELVDQSERVEEMLALAEKECGPEHPAVAQYLEAYAVILRKMNHVAETKQAEQRAEKIRSKNLKEPPPKACDLEPPGDMVNP